MNVLLYFVLVVFLHATDIIACASDEIDVVDETGLRLIRPTSEVWIEQMFHFGSRNFEVLTGNDYRL